MRALQLNDDDDQRSLLYIIYLCILAVCCLSPSVYYIRLYLWQRNRMRRLQQLEQAGLVAALSQTLNVPHARNAALSEERHARICQLLDEVTLVRSLGHDATGVVVGFIRDVAVVVADFGKPPPLTR